MSRQERSLRTRKSYWDFKDNQRDSISDERGLLTPVEQDQVMFENAQVINMDMDWEETKKTRSISKHLFNWKNCLKFLFLICVVIVIGFTVKISFYRNMTHHLYYNGSTYFDQTVIYISIDGFRNDYLQRGVTPNINEIAKQGIRAEYMMPSFPSITFPNHWTLVTGLYPESHGIVANEFYDPELDETFIHKKVEISNQSKWWGGEPIWITSRNQNKKSAVIMWPGANVPIQSVEPNYFIPYQRGPTAQDKMDLVLDWLDLPIEERPQSISVYIPQVDQKGHGGGPDGKQLNGVLFTIDEAIGHLVSGLEKRNLDQHVHLVIVSDHGMASSDNTKHIYYDNFISPEIESYLMEREAWPLLGLRLKKEAPDYMLDQLYQDIVNYTQHNDAHFKVFKRDEIPERYHYSITERIAPIILLPDIGYAIIRSTDKPNTPKGIHGYDNFAFEMRAIFMAKGPKINQSYTEGTIVKPFFNIEMYRFLTTLLDLNPAPNNSTLNGVFNPL